MEKMSVALMLVGIVLLAVSSFLFLFMNHWIVAEAIVWGIGFVMVLGAGKLSNKVDKKH